MKPKTPLAAAAEAELKKLPDVTRGRPRIWTPEEDRLILKYCPTKGMPAVGAILGVKYEAVRKRYKLLEAGKK